MSVQKIVQALPKALRRHKVVRALCAVMGPEQLVEFNDGASLYADLRDGFPRTWMLTGSFDPYFFQIAQAFLPEQGVFFDVGGNAGFCTFGLLPLRPLINCHVFEPNPNLCKLLRRSCLLYGQQSVVINEVAVGEKSGTAFLNTENPDRDLGQAFVSGSDGIRISLTTLDDYISAHGIRRVDFMKLDVEGYELFALRGASHSIAEGVFPVIYFEIKKPLLSRFNIAVRDVLGELRAFGYEIYFVRPEDFKAGVATPSETINNIPAVPVREFPEAHCTDLLAIVQTR
jgi:FkbM family methyltransferase